MKHVEHKLQKMLNCSLYRVSNPRGPHFGIKAYRAGPQRHLDLYRVSNPRGPHFGIKAYRAGPQRHLEYEALTLEADINVRRAHSFFVAWFIEIDETRAIPDLALFIHQKIWRERDILAHQSLAMSPRVAGLTYESLQDMNLVAPPAVLAANIYYSGNLKAPVKDKDTYLNDWQTLYQRRRKLAPRPL
ncbi:hypothetical protein LQW54_000717 [Pestalotiopsis sp. IQ-011]